MRREEKLLDGIMTFSCLSCSHDFLLSPAVVLRHRTLEEQTHSTAFEGYVFIEGSLREQGRWGYVTIPQRNMCSKCPGYTHSLWRF